MIHRLRWHRDSGDWPNRRYSAFVEAAGIEWHVQRAGRGPVVLLLHGTGASTHTWRRLFPALAERYTVIAPDLPGHAFTRMPRDDTMSLPGMAAAVSALLRALAVNPRWIVGHSAGAAIAARGCIDGRLRPDALVGINAALLRFRGAAGWLFPPAARLLASSELAPRLFAWRAADRSVVDRLIRSTGSQPDRESVDLYHRLATSPGHVAAALSMMANWDLPALERDLPMLHTPLLLLAAEGDRTVPPAQAREVARRAPDARVLHLAGVGHLAHEERPGPVVRVLDGLANPMPGEGRDADGPIQAIGKAVNVMLH